MSATPLERSIRALKGLESRRRVIASICFIWGALIIGFGFWSRHRSAEAIGEILEAFYDAPMVAMPAVSALTLSMASSRLNMLIGFAFVIYGGIRFFVPDFKTIVLLGVIKELGLGQKQRGDTDS
jgi:hypothetical protein